MRHAPSPSRSWMFFAALAAAALPWAACGGGGTGGSTTTTTGTGGGTTTTTTTTGDPCTQLLLKDPCDDCIAQHCCSLLDACNTDMSCLDCFLGNTADPAVCGVGATKASLDALLACAGQSCTAICAPTLPACNPVNNTGCAAGAACDTVFDNNQNQTFSCFAPPPPNTVAICGVCDDKTTACLGGSTCLGGSCARFCCNDGDCGTGICESLGAFGVGLCVTAASLDAGVPAPACDAPVIAPSGGSCVTGLDGGVPDSGAPADAGDAG